MCSPISTYVRFYVLCDTGKLGMEIACCDGCGGEKHYQHYPDNDTVSTAPVIINMAHKDNKDTTIIITTAVPVNTRLGYTYK